MRAAYGRTSLCCCAQLISVHTRQVARLCTNEADKFSEVIYINPEASPAPYMPLPMSSCVSITPCSPLQACTPRLVDDNLLKVLLPGTVTCCPSALLLLQASQTPRIVDDAVASSSVSPVP